VEIEVDYTRCTGHGLCELEAEDVFEVDADGVVQVLIPEPDESYRDQVEAAVKVCPTVALRVKG